MSTPDYTAMLSRTLKVNGETIKEVWFLTDKPPVINPSHTDVYIELFSFDNGYKYFTPKELQKFQVCEVTNGAES